MKTSFHVQGCRSHANGCVDTRQLTVDNSYLLRIHVLVWPAKAKSDMGPLSAQCMPSHRKTVPGSGRTVVVIVFWGGGGEDWIFHSITEWKIFIPGRCRKRSRKHTRQTFIAYTKFKARLSSEAAPPLPSPLIGTICGHVTEHLNCCKWRHADTHKKNDTMEPHRCFFFFLEESVFSYPRNVFSPSLLGY